MVLQTSGTITHRNIANEFLVPQNQIRGLSNSFSFSSDIYVPSAPVIPPKGQFRSESYYYGKQNAPEWAIGSLYNTATGSTTLQSVVCDSGNNVFVGGFFTGILTLFNFNGTRSNVYMAAGTQDAFVAKYSPPPTSNVLWAARMTSTGNDAVLGVSTDAAGNVYATGYYTGLMNIYSSSNVLVTNLAQYGGQDVFLVKYGTSGEVQWGARTGSSGTDAGTGVATDSYGNVYVTGYYTAFMNLYSSSNVAFSTAQGFLGGSGTKNGGGEASYGGGGGGGAGTAGTSANNLTSVTAGNGGNGIQYSISGASTYYGGGGGGGCSALATAAGTGGLGGGGAGGKGAAGVNGTNGLGGGGGGSGFNGAVNFVSGKGGTGTVIMSYTTGTITASGGAVTTSSGNTIHTYTVSDSNTFTVTSGGKLNVLLVGGGGSGGTRGAGGGGGGGVVYKESVDVASGTYPVVVGVGGDSQTAIGNSLGEQGGYSSFLTYCALGGGGGGVDNSPSIPGGCGGGGSPGSGSTLLTFGPLQQFGGQDVFLAKYGP